MPGFRLTRLPKDIQIVDANGRVTIAFQKWWQTLVETNEKQEGIQDGLIADLTAAVAAIVDAQAAADAAQAAADAAQTDVNAIDLTPYVLKNQSPAWDSPTGTVARTTFAAYAGQTVSNPPTQAEMQAIDDHLVVLSRRVAALVTDLKVDVLT